MFKLDRSNTTLVVIDIQERLVPAMPEKVYKSMRENTIRLIKGFNVLGAPVMMTQQYSKGLGNTVPEIAELIEGGHVEKTSFSCCGETSFIDKLRESGTGSVVVAGMEAHICVLQTVVDLVEEGFAVHVAADAVMSRAKFNWKTGLDYMAAAGAMVTVTETVLFQMLGAAGSDEFKQVSKLVK